MFQLARTLAQSLATAARRIRRDHHGGTAVLVAISAVPLIGFFGLAVDSGRGYLVKSKLQQALDAAALVGGKVIEEANRDQQIQMFFDANIQQGYMGATITGPTIDANTTTGLVTLDASATFNTTFMSVFGVDTISLDTTATAEQTPPLKIGSDEPILGGPASPSFGYGLRSGNPACALRSPPSAAALCPPLVPACSLARGRH